MSRTSRDCNRAKTKTHFQYRETDVHLEPSLRFSRPNLPLYLSLTRSDNNMTDVQYWEDTLTADMEKIQVMLDKCERMNDLDRKMSGLQKTQKKIRQASQTKRSLKMEIRLVTDVPQRRQYEQRLSKLDQQLKRLGADWKALHHDAERQQLLAGGGPDEENQFNDEDYVKQGDSMLNKASEIQDMTQDSLLRTKQTIAESKEVGVSTLEELERQRGVLETIDKEADRINDNLERAEKLMKAFGKRMASDKFIQCFAVINVLLLVGVVVYAIFGGGLASSDKDGGSPLNPLGR